MEGRPIDEPQPSEPLAMPERPDPRLRRGVAVWLKRVVILAALYAGAGWIGISLAIPPGYATAIWPAAGVAFVALLVFGSGLWPGVLIGSLVVNIGTSWDPSSSEHLARSIGLPLAIGLGAAIQAAVSAGLVRRVLGTPIALVKERHILSFLMLAGPVGCLASATVGVAALSAFGVLPEGGWARNWFTWWAGDALGVLVVAPVALIALGRPRALWRRRALPVGGPVALALVSLLGLFFVASAMDDTRIELAWTKQSDQLAAAIDKDLDRYLEVLEVLARVHALDDRMTPGEFEAFTAAHLARLPGLQALSFDRWVEGADLVRYEDAMRRQVAPDFRVTERAADGAKVAVEARDLHVVVENIAPIEGNAPVRGYDIASEATRRAAALRARDTGQPSATPPVPLIQHYAARQGFLILVPVYQDPSPATVESRRATIVGFAVGVFVVEDMLAAALMGMSDGQVDTWIYENSPGGVSRLLHARGVGAVGADGAPRREPPPNALSRFVHRDMAGRRWSIHMHPGPAFRASHRGFGAWWILVAGLLLASLVSAFQLALTGRAYVDERRAGELEAANSRLGREIAVREHVELALAHERERAVTTLNALTEAVITTDRHGSVDFMNPIAEALIGVGFGEACGRPLHAILRLLEEDSDTPIPDPVAEAFEAPSSVAGARYARLITRGGVECVVQASSAAILEAGLEASGVVLVLSDVTESRRKARRIAHAAAHDALTGLANRREFETRLDRAIATARRDGAQHALCFLDLDEFKKVNDIAGHAAGDRLLEQLAAELRRSVRSRDTLARLGGDEFGLLLANCPTDKAVEIARNLVSLVRDFRLTWKGKVFQVGVSIGLVPLDGGDASATDLMRYADAACYQAKALGRMQVQLHDPRLSTPARGHAALVGADELTRAIDDERFALWVQPVVRLTARAADPEAYEVLLRLEDAESGCVLPGAFLPAADRNGMMPAVDRWVIQTALSLHGRWFQGPRKPRLCINLRGTSLSDDGLLDFVERCLAASGVDPRHLAFELSENDAVHHLGQVARFVEGLRPLGCRFALDHFGSGLASVTTLRRLCVDEVKIDGPLVERIVHDRVDRATVVAIHEVARELGVQTIAQHVESEAIADVLRSIGVAYGQGFALGAPRPLPLADANASAGRGRTGRRVCTTSKSVLVPGH